MNFHPGATQSKIIEMIRGGIADGSIKGYEIACDPNSLYALHYPQRLSNSEKRIERITILFTEDFNDPGANI